MVGHNGFMVVFNLNISIFSEIMLKLKYIQFLKVIDRYPWWNYWGPVCGIAIAIFISSSISHPPTSGIRIPEFDKFLHSIGYAVFGYFSRRAFSQTKRDLFTQYAGIFAIVFCVFYGISDEIHQSFVPPRETDPIDLLADTIGATIGQAIHYIKQTRNKKQMLTAKNAE